MGAIAKTLMPSNRGPGVVSSGGGIKAPLNVTVLSLADTLKFEAESDQYLFLRNGTGGSITVTLDGQDAPSNFAVPGYGVRTLAAGYAVVLAIGDKAMIPLDSIKGYLSGVVDVTSTAPGVVAAFISYK